MTFVQLFTLNRVNGPVEPPIPFRHPGARRESLIHHASSKGCQPSIRSERGSRFASVSDPSGMHANDPQIAAAFIAHPRETRSSNKGLADSHDES